MAREWLLLAAAGLAAMRVALGWRRQTASPVPVILGALIALGALAALVQVRPFLPPGGLRIAAGLVFLEMGVHALFDGLRHRSGTPGPVANPTVVLKVGESVATGILLAWVTNRTVWVGLAVAAGGLMGLVARRPGLARNRWLAAAFSMWFLGTGLALLFGRPG